MPSSMWGRFPPKPTPQCENAFLLSPGFSEFRFLMDGRIDVFITAQALGIKESSTSHPELNHSDLIRSSNVSRTKIEV